MTSHSMRPLLATAGAILLTSCGGGPNPTITVSLDPFPDRTAETSVLVTGSVSRSPSGDKPITISVAGGRNTLVDSIVGTEVFAFSVRLNTNQENQIVVTASDANGGISEPVIAVILHDDTGPTVDDMTPPAMSTEVALDTPIEVFFGEPLLATAGANVRLLHNQMPVPGNVTLSPDMRRVTITPSETLRPNSIYEIEFTGYTDAAGNVVAAGDACFLTSSLGIVQHSAVDTIDLDWLRGNPGTTLRNDLISARFAREDSTFFGLLEFSRPSVFGFPDDSSTIAFIEFDIDQMEGTGFTSLRDTIFRQFPELDSELGVEMVVGLEPAVGDSGYVAVYDNPLEFTVLDAFKPGQCGRYYGFHTTALLDSAGDDGLFDYTIVSFAIGNNGDLIDVMPENGHLTADLLPVTTAAPSYRIDHVRPRQTGVRGSLADRIPLSRIHRR